MKVFVEETHDLPLVSATVSFRAGSAHDPAEKGGLARVTARMLRRGAAGKSATEIEEAIDGLGGEMAGDVGFSATSISFEVIKRSLPAFADLAASILARPTFDATELGKLLRESEGELIESRDNDGGLASRAFRRTVFEGHPYGRRGAGSIASLKTIGVDDVRGFYARHYNRANAVIAIAGDVTVDEAHALAAKLVAGLPEGSPTPDEVSEPQPRTGRTLVFVDKPDRTQTQMVIGGLGTHARDPDHVPLMVANTAFGGTFTARLMHEVRSKRGWSYGASSRLGLDRHREAFSMWTAPGANDAAACLELELKLLDEWRSFGITKKELSFTQQYLGRSYVFDIDTAQKRVHQKLAAELGDLPDGYYERYVEAVRAVDKASADAAAKARAPHDGLVVTVVGTHATLGGAIEKAIPNLAEVRVVPFDQD